MTDPTVPPLSPQALLATDEAVRIGLDQFFAKHPPAGSGGFLVELGQAYIPAQSVAAAIGLNALNLSTTSARKRAELQLLEHGLLLSPAAVCTPPQIGETHPDRTAIKNRYGGDLVAGIVRFPGDTTVNCFADESGAYADDSPTQDADFGYRGDGLYGDQKLTSPGNKRLESARLAKSRIRFWHKPRGGVFTFEMWCVVVERSWGWGQDLKKEKRREVVWTLRAVGGQAAAPLEESQDDLAEKAVADMDQGVGPEVQRNPSYSQLVKRLDERPLPRRVNNRLRRDPARRLAARRSVLIRAGEQCESSWCTGMAKDRSRSGGPLLEVDHVKDLALGGNDHPDNMVALCPNCHAAKTRGDQAELRRKQLTKIARERHAAAMTRDPRAEP